MFALLPLLGGPLGKLLGIVGAVVGIAVAITWAFAQHDGKLRAQADLARAEMDLTALHAQAARNETALTANLVAVQARAVSQQRIRERIASAPTTNACAAAPAIRSALDGLLPSTPAGPGAAPRPSSTPAVPAGAHAAPR